MQRDGLFPSIESIGSVASFACRALFCGVRSCGLHSSAVGGLRSVHSEASTQTTLC